MTDPLLLLIAFIVGTVGIARLVRLITSDMWPPIAWARQWWLMRTEYLDDDAPHQWRRGWGLLFTCPFCHAPYPTAVALAVAHWAGIWTPDLSTLAGWCWTLAVWATISYLAAMIVVRDEPEPIEVD